MKFTQKRAVNLTDNKRKKTFKGGMSFKSGIQIIRNVFSNARITAKHWEF